MAQLYGQLLRCEPTELKLLKQQLVRVDTAPDAVQTPTKWASETPFVGTVVLELTRRGRCSQHMDQAFLPRHYATTPRSVYYHSMLALSDVVSGGAPFLAATGSYQRALGLTGALSEEEQRQFEADYTTHADASGTR